MATPASRQSSYIISWEEARRSRPRRGKAVAYSAVSIRSREARTPGHGLQTPQNCVQARLAATFVHSLLPRIPPRLKQALAQLPPALGLPAEPTPKPILDLPATKPETAQNPASDLLHSHPPPPSGL